MKKKSNSSISKSESERRKRAQKMVSAVRSGEVGVYTGQAALARIKLQQVYSEKVGSVDKNE